MTQYHPQVRSFISMQINADYSPVGSGCFTVHLCAVHPWFSLTHVYSTSPPLLTLHWLHTGHRFASQIFVSGKQKTSNFKTLSSDIFHLQLLASASIIKLHQNV